MNNDLISIIIPVYNVEKYLNNCIDSVIKQSHKNLEIILIDDGSTDTSPSICDSYKKKDQRIKVIHKTNRGLSDARNAGILKATGKYIGFVDSDDEINKEMFAILHNNINKYNADISVCNYYFIRQDKKINKPYTNEVLVTNTEEALDLLYSNKKFGNFAWNKLYKKGLFDNIKFPYGKKYEDIWIMHEIYSCATTIVFQDLPLYLYFERENSILGQESIQTTLDYFDGMINRAKFKTTKGREKYIATTLLNRIVKSQKQIFNNKIDKFERQKLIEKCNFCLNTYCKNEYLSYSNIKIKEKLIKNPQYFAIKHKIRSSIRKSKIPLLKSFGDIYIKYLSN